MSLSTENGRRTVPPPDVHAPPLVHDQPPQTLFEPLPESDEPQVPLLTPEGSEYLHRSLPALKVDRGVIRKLVDGENADEAVRQYAQTTFDSDPGRCNRWAIISRTIKSLDDQIADATHLLQQWVNRRETTAWRKIVWMVRNEDFWQLTTIPKMVLLVTFLGLFVFGFAAELKNAVYMVQESGLGYEGDPFGALCFVFPIVVGPVLALKSLEYCLSAAGRDRFRFNLNRFATPFALGTVGLFAWTIGLMHSDVDLLGGTGSWTPPLWAILGCEMVLLALMGTMLTRFLQTSLGTFFDFDPEPNSESVEVGRRAERLKTVLREMDGLRGQLLGVLRRLEGERKAFIEASLGELRHQHHALVAKRAQVNLDPLDT